MLQGCGGYAAVADLGRRLLAERIYPDERVAVAVAIVNRLRRIRVGAPIVAVQNELILVRPRSKSYPGLPRPSAVIGLHGIAAELPSIEAAGKMDGAYGGRQR